VLVETNAHGGASLKYWRASLGLVLALHVLRIYNVRFLKMCLSFIQFLVLCQTSSRFTCSYARYTFEDMRVHRVMITRDVGCFSCSLQVLKDQI